LPSPAKVPPSGTSWHKIKHDGFRILARRDSAGVRITRAGNDFSFQHQNIAAETK
jgi:ATP-dependent DNA ligase